MPRVLHVITGLGTGGAEATLVRLLQADGGSDLEHAVISLGRERAFVPTLTRAGIRTEVLEMPPGRPSMRGLIALARATRDIAPDLVQGWMYHGNLGALSAARVASGKVPVLWNVRQSLPDLADEKSGTARAIRLSARFADGVRRILYNSRRAAADHEAIGFPPASSLVIPNGFDLERFRPRVDERTELRQELGLPVDAPTIGLVGRYHPVKGHAVFFEAATALAAGTPELIFVLAGPEADASNPALADQVKRSGLGDRVRLLGPRDDVERLTAALDIACCTSHAESLPNVVGEAMACGVPCVATDVGDVADLLGDAGRLVPPGDSVALADAWRQLLDLEPSERHAIGMRGRNRIADGFDLRTMARRYDAIWHETIEQPTTERERR